jgi:uncharacterized protein (DUF934 family)
MVLVKNGKPISDDWRHLEDSDPLPESGRVTVSWTRWIAEREGLNRPAAELGVRAANTVAANDLGADAARFGLVVLTFPSFSDGRAFSQARVLRSRFNYAGELRATGGVLRDQLQFMQRCGFDTFEVPERALTEDWFQALSEFDLFYQPAEDNRPWIARQRQRRN